VQLTTTSSTANWRTLLSNGSFVALWIGQIVAQTGDPFRQMALQIIVFEQTGSSGALAVLATVMALPTLVVGPIAGVLVDRWPRRSVMLFSHAARAALVTVLVLSPNVPTVYAISVATATIASFYMPARNAILPNLVHKDDVLKANSFSLTTGTLLMMASPALAAIVIGWLGSTVALAVNAASFALAAVAVFFIRVRPASTPAVSRMATAERAWLGEMLEGARFVRQSPVISGIIALFAIQTIGFAVVPVLQVVLVTQGLGLPANHLGYLMAVFAVGMLAGGFATPWISHRVRPTLLITLSCIGYGVFFLLLSISEPLPLVYLWLATMGMCEAALSVAVPSLLQRIVPDELRGRVFSVQNTTLTLMMVIGMAIAGMAAEVLPVRTVFACGAVISILGGLLGFRLFAGVHDEPMS
jgi:MFS family permease